ncbi:adenylosuccinate synthetase [Thecamonas trahens ATCC 50062]|uniref:Adenylosuccinate synthetase n=1 Tax=Thecamonas trahens ATCC 50062 TaxID=461836 RepID=A0A0L0D4W7_THETB|nr:adenylosuccinate synthetase [Thecamonas trahens ATCC 50062]KNC47290.1 adenylosuccinate synthetase [Thecamonas trahens ATCC 50062]|eukprot:XP_013759631.1 adenylosuccinate synthetase [Thecamonas trahens ATCC 50062]
MLSAVASAVSPLRLCRLASTAATPFASSRVTAVLGAQWGDEGKGKLADVLAEDYDVVGRFNGGANAGHTVIADGVKYAFHLLPCGLVYPHTLNILGNGTVIHLPSMFDELAQLDGTSVSWEGRLKLSNRAHLLFDYHQIIDGVLEERRGAGKSLGTTKKGIGPAYASKALRLGIRVGDLVDFDDFAAKFRSAVDSHQKMYGFDYGIDDELERYRAFADILTNGDMIVDSVAYVNQAYNDGKRIILEGANAALLDLDYGTYPFVTSSPTTVGGVCTGLGLAPGKIECTVGVVKAYTTRVGWGPFPTELTDVNAGGERAEGAPGADIGAHLQSVGGEIGVTTGRKRRCGWLDIPLLQYSNMVNGYSAVNVTKLDVLDDLETIKIGVAYRDSTTGETLAPGHMPSTIAELARVEVVYEEVPGWQSSTQGITEWAELPPNAQAYIQRMEDLLEVPMTWIGTGPGRDEMVIKPHA